MGVAEDLCGLGIPGVLAGYMQDTFATQTSAPNVKVLSASFQSSNPSGSQAIVYAGASGRSNSWLFAQLGLTGTVTNDAIFGVAMAAGMRISPDTVDASASSPFAYFGIDARASVGRRGTRSGIRANVLVNGTASILETYPAVVGVQGTVGISANQNGTTGAATNYIGATFGGNSNTYATSGATFINSIVGHEDDISVRTGASVAYKIGHSIVKGSLDAVRGVYTDAAFSIADQDGAAVTWLNGFEFGGYSKLWAFGPDSTLFASINRTIPAPATSPALYGIDFSNLTITTGGAGVLMPLITPASAAATGKAGSIVWDANFIYICTATNTWKRVAIASW